MTHTVIDTLRLTNRLKEEGVADEQAEALARALGDELRHDPAPKNGSLERVEREDLARSGALTGEVRLLKWAVGLGAAIALAAFVLAYESLFSIMENQGRISERMRGLEVKIDERFSAVDEQFKAVDERFKAVDERFKAVDEHFKAVDYRLVALERQVAGVEALVRELISIQRNGLAGGLEGSAGTPAGEEGEDGPGSVEAGVATP